MKTVKMAASTLLALSLSACLAGPDYQKPAANLPASFAHTPTSAPSPELKQWWLGFHDPVLTRLIEQALSGNLDLAVAEARLQQAEALAAQADASLRPQIAADASLAEQRQSLRSPIGELASHSPGYQRRNSLHDEGVGLSWEPDFSGGLRRGREAGRAEAEAAADEQLAVRVAVAADTADAYFRLRGAEARIALAESQLATDQKLLDLINLRLQDGVATRREQAEAEARLAQLRASLPPLRTEQGLQANRLDVLLGHAAGQSSELAAGSPLQLPGLNLGLTPADLLSHRPDVMAAERHLAASNARIGIASSGYYPQLSLAGLLGFEGLNTATLNGTTFQPQAAVGLHWRLFDFGRVDAEVAQAKGAEAEALARYRQAMLRATEDVEDALLSEQELLLQRQDLQAELAADTQARDSAQEAYTGGTASAMEVLEQDRQLLTARDQLALADTGAARAVVATYRAVGAGW